MNWYQRLLAYIVLTAAASFVTVALVGLCAIVIRSALP